jgi:hypothetical protein
MFQNTVNVRCPLDSSVGIVTRLGDRGIEVLFSAVSTDRLWGLPTLIQRVPEVKLLERETYHFILVPRLKIKEVIPSILHAPSWRGA